jgi:hypothetical protein
MSIFSYSYFIFFYSQTQDSEISEINKHSRLLTPPTSVYISGNDSPEQLECLRKVIQSITTISMLRMSLVFFHSLETNQLARTI